MNADFEQIIDQLPGLLGRLLNSEMKPWSNLGHLPPSGVYVFYENGKAIYVGRTNRMRERIKEHGRPSSTHNSAPFAFNVTKKAGKEKGINVSKPRVELERDPLFKSLFTEAKVRVSKMSVRVIEINNPILQTIFEVYASMDLKTEINDFDTH